MVLLLSTGCLVAFSLALLINLLVEVFVEILLLLQLEAVLSGDFRQGIEWHEVLVDVLDWSGGHAPADGISQVEVVLEAEGPLAAAEVVLAENDAVEFVANGQVVFDAGLAHFMNESVGIDGQYGEPPDPSIHTGVLSPPDLA